MALTGRDIVKLQKAGFTVLRLDIINRRIEQATSTGGWMEIATYETDAETLLDWRLLMNKEKVVEG